MWNRSMLSCCSEEYLQSPECFYGLVSFDRKLTISPFAICKAEMLD